MTPHDDLIRAIEALKCEPHPSATRHEIGKIYGFNEGVSRCLAIIHQHAAKVRDINYADGETKPHMAEPSDSVSDAPLREGDACIPNPSAPSDEVVERVAKAICRAGHDDDADFEESWKEHRVGYIIEAGAAIAAMPKQPVDLRQPIETAPKDGTRILALMNYNNPEYNEWKILKWDKPQPFGNTEMWTTDEEGPGYSSGYNEAEIQGWMPLPDITKMQAKA